MMFINFANSNDVRTFRIYQKNHPSTAPLRHQGPKTTSKICKLTKYRNEGLKLQFLSYFGLMTSLEYQKHSFKTNYSVESQFEVPLQALNGQKMTKIWSKNAKTIIQSFQWLFFFVALIFQLKYIQGHHKVSFETIYTIV